jgi:hypothetical protein
MERGVTLATRSACKRAIRWRTRSHSIGPARQLVLPRASGRRYVSPLNSQRIRITWPEPRSGGELPHVVRGKDEADHEEKGADRAQNHYRHIHKV